MARRPLNRLTAREVQTIRKPGRHADGQGLYLHVDESGAKRWVFVFQWRGRRKEMGLGPVDLVELKAARDAKDAARRLVFAGKNPIEERRRNRGEVPTFGALADEVVDALSLRNDKHREQWRKTMTDYAAPLRDMAVNDIDTDDILATLRPIWTRIPETASKVRGRIERVLDAAKARGYRVGENPARWRGHLALLIPRSRRTVKHYEALPGDQLPAFMAELRTREGVSALALEWTILTAGRTNETRWAVWPEIDRKRKLWTIPAERMKGGREHRVPLSPAALAILDKLPGGGYLFPGRSKGGCLSNMSMDKVLRSMGREVTVHGFRSTFKDWAEDHTDFPNGVIEAALSHLVGDEVERAYRRGDALEKRRDLMDAWAAYCATPPAPPTPDVPTPPEE